MNKGIAFFIISILLWVPPLFVETQEEVSKEIPDDAIRLRILANSDSEEDQQMKLKVRDQVNEYIDNLVVDIADIDEARQTIREHVPVLNNIVAEELAAEDTEMTHSVEYDSNVSFPTKKYGNYVYPAGEYEAVLITLGEGDGENWWCVLFPPLCFLDFSNETPVADSEADDEASSQNHPVNDSDDEIEDLEHSEQIEDEEEVEVKFFLFEWLGLS